MDGVRNTMRLRVEKGVGIVCHVVGSASVRKPSIGILIVSHLKACKKRKRIWASIAVWTMGNIVLRSGPSRAPRAGAQ